MKKIHSSILIFLLLISSSSIVKSSIHKNSFTQDYEGQIVFPADYKIGDYAEFLRIEPISAGSSGYYEVSISYTRGNIASAATHLVAVSHYNPSAWRECGRVNNNKYVDQTLNFTVDCNGQSGNSRFRIRCVAVSGSTDQDLLVYIKVRAINTNGAYSGLDVRGNDLTVNKFQPMTNDWSLYVGNLFSTEGASLAIQAIQNGNVGIGTATPNEKLSVNGKIRAHEIKVETSNWPDYVFDDDYKIEKLEELERYIKVNKHLPDMPSAKEVEKNGIALGEMNKLLLKKIEELTLYLIEKDKEIKELQKLIKK